MWSWNILRSNHSSGLWSVGPRPVSCHSSSPTGTAQEPLDHPCCYGWREATSCRILETICSLPKALWAGAVPRTCRSPNPRQCKLRRNMLGWRYGALGCCCSKTGWTWAGTATHAALKNQRPASHFLSPWWIHDNPCGMEWYDVGYAVLFMAIKNG